MVDRNLNTVRQEQSKAKRGGSKKGIKKEKISLIRFKR